ncbi:MAG: putative PEP-binding protein [Candidatus Omnitrophota bacterium]
MITPIKTNNKALKKIFALILVQIFLFTGIVQSAPQEFLAPSVQVTHDAFKTAFGNATTTIRGPRDTFRETENPPAPLYVIPGHGMDVRFPFIGSGKINNRLRTYKEDLVLSTIAARNARAEAFLNTGDKANFIFIDLHLADHLLSTFPPEHTNQASKERLIQQLEDYTLLLEKFLNNNKQGNYASISNPEGAHHTEILTLSLTEMNVINFVSQQFNAHITHSATDSGDLVGRTNGKWVMVGLYEFQGQETYNPIPLDNISDSQLPKHCKCTVVDLTSRKLENMKLLRKANARYHKQRPLENITDEVRAEIRNGFEVHGVPNGIGRKVVHGTMVVADIIDSRPDLSYPMPPYSPENFRTARGELRLATSKIYESFSFQDNNKDRARKILSSAIKNASTESGRTGFNPTLFFLASIRDVILQLNTAEDKTLKEDLANISKQISDTIYPPLHASFDDDQIKPQSKKENNLAKAAKEYLDNYLAKEKQYRKAKEALVPQIQAEKSIEVIELEKQIAEQSALRTKSTDDTIREQYIDTINKLEIQLESVKSDKLKALEDNFNKQKTLEEDMHKYWGLGKSVWHVAVKILREQDCSIPEAIFRAANPYCVYLMRYADSDHFAGSYTTFAEISSELLSNWEIVTNAPITRKVSLKNVPENKPFILFLPRDLKNPTEYFELRDKYPNMVAIISRAGLKHYGTSAKQERFPVLNEAASLVNGRRVSTRQAIEGNEPAILDTETHILKLWPTREELIAAQLEEKMEQAEEIFLNRRISLPVVTTDGVSVQVMANLDRAEDASKLAKLGIKNVGLYRTEYAYMQRGDITENEWVRIFTTLVQDSQADFISMRLADRKVTGKGEDIKNVPAFGNSSEEGIRFLLFDSVGRNIALTQLRAAMRVYAKHKVIGAMFPMISTTDHGTRALALFDEAKQNLIDKGLVTERDLEGFNKGLMFETPSAVDASKGLMERFSFGSFGSNDYTSLSESFSRGDEGSTERLTEFTPNILHASAKLVQSGMPEITSGRTSNFPLSICGNVASNPYYLLYAAYAASKGGLIKPSVGLGETAKVMEFIRHIDTRKLAEIFEDSRTQNDEITLKTALTPEVERITKEIALATDAVFQEIMFNTPVESSSDDSISGFPATQFTQMDLIEQAI